MRINLWIRCCLMSALFIFGFAVVGQAHTTGDIYGLPHGESAALVGLGCHKHTFSFDYSADGLQDSPYEIVDPSECEGEGAPQYAFAGADHQLAVEYNFKQGCLLTGTNDKSKTLHHLLDEIAADKQRCARYDQDVTQEQYDSWSLQQRKQFAKSIKIQFQSSSPVLVQAPDALPIRNPHNIPMVLQGNVNDRTKVKINGVYPDSSTCTVTIDGNVLLRDVTVTGSDFGVCVNDGAGTLQDLNIHAPEFAVLVGLAADRGTMIVNSQLTAAVGVAIIGEGAWALANRYKEVAINQGTTPIQWYNGPQKGMYPAKITDVETTPEENTLLVHGSAVSSMYAAHSAALYIVEGKNSSYEPANSSHCEVQAGEVVTCTLSDHNWMDSPADIAVLASYNAGSVATAPMSETHLAMPEMQAVKLLPGNITNYLGMLGGSSDDGEEEEEIQEHGGIPPMQIDVSGTVPVGGQSFDGGGPDTPTPVMPDGQPIDVVIPAPSGDSGGGDLDGDGPAGVEDPDSGETESEGDEDATESEGEDDVEDPDVPPLVPLGGSGGLLSNGGTVPGPQELGGENVTVNSTEAERELTVATGSVTSPAGPEGSFESISRPEDNKAGQMFSGGCTLIIN